MSNTAGQKIWLAILVLLMIGVGFFVTGSLAPHSPTSKLQLEAVPGGSKIIVNGKSLGEGTKTVGSGEIKIDVSKEGFASFSQSFFLNPDELKYFGVVLKSNSPSTATWYGTHPKDQKKSEGISSSNFDATSEKNSNSNTVLKLLPYIGAGGEFSVDYGVGPDTNGDLRLPTVYIEATTAQGRRDALLWMKNKGYDISSNQIIFTGALSPFAVGDN